MNDDESIDQETIAALRAFNTSAMNGIILLAARLRGADLLDDQHIREFHESLSLPLMQPEVADNPFVAPMQDYVDSRLADLLGFRRDLNLLKR